MTKIELTENDVKKDIIKYLNRIRALYIRNNSGAMVIKGSNKNRFLKFGSKGSPDILVWRRQKAYGIEVKAPHGKQSPDQVDWQKTFEKEGGVYILAKDVFDVVDVIRQ